MTDLWRRILNWFLSRNRKTNKALTDLGLCIEEGVTDSFLSLLLEAMSLLFLVDKEFARNIKDFDATYVFRDQAGLAATAVIFHGGHMRVKAGNPENPSFALIYKDGCSLFKMLMSPAPDILNAMLNQEVSFTGNLNYINKFSYMAMHIRSMLEAHE